MSRTSIEVVAEQRLEDYSPLTAGFLSIICISAG